VNRREWETLKAELLRAIGSDGEPPYGQRTKLRRALEAHGRTSWALAELEAARKVLPIWSAAFPAAGPSDLLGLAEQALSDADARWGLERAALQYREVLAGALDDAGDTGAYRPVYAGLAAWAASRAALGANEIQDGQSELDFDPDDWDACFYGSLAWSGGAVWEPEVDDPTARRAFWEWFVAEAVATGLERGGTLDSEPAR
jgi:hypothetical protein